VLISGIVNVKVLSLLGQPLTYQWLYYSDFLQSFDARHAIMASVSPRIVVAVILGPALLVLCSWASIKILQSVRSWHRSLIGAAGLLLSSLLLIYSYPNRSRLDYAVVANPLIELLRSAWADTTPRLLTAPTRFPPDDLRIVAERPPSQSTFASARRGRVRNVLIFIMESASPEYIQPYGGEFPVTPNLESVTPISIQFDAMYAHAPVTNKALFSILTSLYPMISYESEAAKHPDIAAPTLSSALKDRGYSTALFSSADLRFQSQDKFLKSRGFDRLADHRDITCAESTKEGVNDACTADALLHWIDGASSGPFFAMFWTNMTHYPYFVVGDEVAYERQNANLNRYLNALRISDETLGRIIKHLSNKGLLDSTLIVVVGDHGEAFGRHDQVVHSRRIYQENVHIPAILINPALFSGERSPVVGGLVDLAPTIFDLLGYDLPATWQGRSLFDSARSGRVYFFSVWDGFRFGYREGDRKYIFEALSNRLEVYDLMTDPHEQHDLSTDMHDEAPAVIERLAAWMQYQTRLFDMLVNLAGEPAGRGAHRKRHLAATAFRYRRQPRAARPSSSTAAAARARGP
jgi:lipoteichoic acid synthase